ncbi:hypothetical protein LIER_23423 [Lithospermum erythrorhizon]|uniref:Uncharacterized protein n=1 Tax=Lithospermum erythrorhizon TaxID=34254 RepID=A0AAV3R0U1_LITER
MNVSNADDTMTDVGKQTSAKNLGEFVDLSVKDTVDGLKKSAPIGGDETRPTVIDTINDPLIVENVTPSVRATVIEDAEGMVSIDVPSAAATDGLTVGREDVTPSVAATGAGAAGLLEERVEPIIGDGFADTLNDDMEDLEIPEDAGQEKKKSKKRKHKSGVDDAGETS